MQALCNIFKHLLKKVSLLSFFFKHENHIFYSVLIFYLVWIENSFIWFGMGWFVIYYDHFSDMKYKSTEIIQDWGDRAEGTKSWSS